MFDKTFTQSQILCGLRIFWSEQSLDHSFEPDKRIDHQLQAEGIWDEIDHALFVEAIEEFFGFSCPGGEWERFFGWSITDPDEWEREVGHRLTFDRLADFIRERLEAIPLEPLTLLGKPCLTAGIFRGLEQLAEQIHPTAIHFAPSTPIRASLRGSRLRMFWNRLRWITEERIPAPRRIKLGCGGFYFKVGIGLFIALCKRDLEGLWLSLKVTALLFLPTAFLVEFINSRINPLPKEIETFGDLARYLAAITVAQQPECA